MDSKDAIKAIDAFCDRFGIKATSVGQMAVRNRRAYESIKSGGASLNTTRLVLEWVETETLARSASQTGDAA